MYKALYRAYRPEIFSQVLGQEHIVKILKHQLAHGEISHAYLFCGTRGTGKTTLARLLAKGVNCLSFPEEGEIPCGVCENCMAIKDGQFMDMVEIDAASNNGINDIRELSPDHQGKFHAYNGRFLHSSRSVRSNYKDLLLNTYCIQDKDDLHNRTTQRIVHVYSLPLHSSLYSIPCINHSRDIQHRNHR